MFFRLLAKKRRLLTDEKRVVTTIFPTNSLRLFECIRHSILCLCLLFFCFFAFFIHRKFVRDDEDEKIHEKKIDIFCTGRDRFDGNSISQDIIEREFLNFPIAHEKKLLHLIFTLVLQWKDKFTLNNVLLKFFVLSVKKLLLP